MTRYRFYSDSLLSHQKATMQTTPKPSKIYTLQTYSDEQNLMIIERREVFITSHLPGEPEYFGQSMAMVAIHNPRNGQIENQQMQFQFPIPATSIHQAFALFDDHQEPGFHKHMEALKIARIKQGADLSQLPKPGKN